MEDEEDEDDIPIIRRLRKEIKREKDITKNVGVAVNPWRNILRELYTTSVESEQEENEWRVRCHYQRSYNDMLKQRVKDLKREMRILRTGQEWDTSMKGDMRKMTLTECRIHVKHLETDRNSIQSLRSMYERQLDHESLEYVKVKEKRTSVLREILVLQQTFLRQQESFEREYFSKLRIKYGGSLFRPSKLEVRKSQEKTQARTKWNTLLKTHLGAKHFQMAARRQSIGVKPLPTIKNPPKDKEHRKINRQKGKDAETSRKSPFGTWQSESGTRHDDRGIELNRGRGTRQNDVNVRERSEYYDKAASNKKADESMGKPRYLPSLDRGSPTQHDSIDQGSTKYARDIPDQTEHSHYDSGSESSSRNAGHSRSESECSESDNRQYQGNGEYSQSDVQQNGTRNYRHQQSSCDREFSESGHQQYQRARGYSPNGTERSESIRESIHCDGTEATMSPTGYRDTRTQPQRGRTYSLSTADCSETRQQLVRYQRRGRDHGEYSQGEGHRSPEEDVASEQSEHGSYESSTYRDEDEEDSNADYSNVVHRSLRSMYERQLDHESLEYVKVKEKRTSVLREILVLQQTFLRQQESFEREYFSKLRIKYGGSLFRPSKLEVRKSQEKTQARTKWNTLLKTHLGAKHFQMAARRQSIGVKPLPTIKNPPKDKEHRKINRQKGKDAETSRKSPFGTWQSESGTRHDDRGIELNRGRGTRQNDVNVRERSEYYDKAASNKKADESMGKPRYLPSLDRGSPTQHDSIDQGSTKYARDIPDQTEHSHYDSGSESSSRNAGHSRSESECSESDNRQYQGNGEYSQSDVHQNGTRNYRHQQSEFSESDNQHYQRARGYSPNGTERSESIRESIHCDGTEATMSPTGYRDTRTQPQRGRTYSLSTADCSETRQQLVRYQRRGRDHGEYSQGEGHRSPEEDVASEQSEHGSYESSTYRDEDEEDSNADYSNVVHRS